MFSAGSVLAGVKFKKFEAMCIEVRLKTVWPGDNLLIHTLVSSLTLHRMFSVLSLVKKPIY